MQRNPDKVCRRKQNPRRPRRVLCLKVQENHINYAKIKKNEEIEKGLQLGICTIQWKKKERPLEESNKWLGKGKVKWGRFVAYVYLFLCFFFTSTFYLSISLSCVCCSCCGFLFPFCSEAKLQLTTLTRINFYFPLSIPTFCIRKAK